jgi:hypothetical protein
MSEGQTPKQQCEALGIAIIAPTGQGYYPRGWSYVGVFPPARRWPTEEGACVAALAHYWAIQPEED